MLTAVSSVNQSLGKIGDNILSKPTKVSSIHYWHQSGFLVRAITGLSDTFTLSKKLGCLKKIYKSTSGEPEAPFTLKLHACVNGLKPV